MRLHSSLDTWAARLFAALALTPIAACSSSVEAPLCEGASPFTIGGKETGFVSCGSEGDQWKHRPKASTCPSELPRSLACEDGIESGPPGSCVTDADCTEHPNGFCANASFDSPSCSCQYGCLTDADCGSGKVCLCGSPVGECVQASCKTDKDCGGGLCATFELEPHCGGQALACTSSADECMTDSDCQGGSACTVEGDHRVCKPGICSIGRPFLVAGEARTAPAAARNDWRAEGLAPRLVGLSEGEREALAAHWAGAGRMEHASIAAFARFVLQLLAAGAPPELIRDAQAAMADETRHTEVCFALASAYAGRGVGPGHLCVDRALDDSDLSAIVVTAIHEGCVGETVAAIEAAEAAAHAEDPAIRAVLATIADDEARHAELAFCFVRWAIAGSSRIAGVAAAAFAAATAEGPSEATEEDSPLLAHGVVGEGLRGEIRRRALRSVIAPCAEALVAAALGAAGGRGAAISAHAVS